MSILPDTPAAFRAAFATESAAHAFLVSWRWPNGFVCPTCSGRRFAFLARRRLWQCRACRRQTSITAGTALQHSKIPLRIWAYALWSLGRPDVRTSALQFQRDTGLRTYESALHLFHKVRIALSNPEKRPLRGPIERGARGFDGRALKDPMDSPVVVAAVARDGTASARIEPRAPPDLPQIPLRIAAFFAGFTGWLRDTHHGVTSGYLPLYLDEHVYRSNRRRLGWRTFGYLARRVMTAGWAAVAPSPLVQRERRRRAANASNPGTSTMAASPSPSLPQQPPAYIPAPLGPRWVGSSVS